MKNSVSNKQSKVRCATEKSASDTTIAIIPARGGSKGLPDKNISEINGKPLILWTIEQAISSQFVDRVIVSTDSDKIAQISEDGGAEVPFLRPPNISDDFASTESALLHCCEQLDYLPENILLLQCTSPIRKPTTIDEAVKFFNSGGYDSVLSVCKNHSFFWTNLANPKPSYNYTERPRRQEICPENTVYKETGSIYLTKTVALIESKNRLSGKIGLFETDAIESFEIDTYSDFKICEALMKVDM